MTNLEIGHTLAGSPRVVQAYLASEATTRFALSAEETTPGGAPKVRGDRLPLPETLEVRIWIDEGTLEASADLAYLIVEEAETAGSLAWHEGFIVVYPITAARVRQEGVAVELTLWFPWKDASFVGSPGGTYDGVDLGTGL